jgi:hypothetical protein
MPKDGQDAVKTVTISIELELEIGRQSDDRQCRLDDLAGELMALFDKHQLAGTWAVADPAHSAAAPAILASPVGHELAVLGDAAWLGPGVSRQRMERELARRFDGARQSGVNVSTLLLRNVREPLDLELLLSSGVTAVAYWPAAPADESDRPSPRYGLWHAPPAWRLPAASRWLPAAWIIARRLRQPHRRTELLHVAIDSAALVERGESALAQIRCLMSQLARGREAGMWQVRTLQSLAAEALGERKSQPMRSILKPAA